ncbi:hypothetical protein PG985_000031 [Apiospora marii]|uniref:Uncharacterized protein n=1 Tax=Apiospora marii TaxID=335849 RepID=A0ABR1R1G6_9PEZI
MAPSKTSKIKSKGKGKGQYKAVLAPTPPATMINDNNSRNTGEQQQDHNDDEGSGNNNSSSGKKLSSSAVNIKRREDYANMDAASKDRERTRVKRSRAVKMARDSLPGTAWVELGRKAQVEVAGAIAEEIRYKYAATTPGPSSRTAAEYAVQKIFAEKLHVFFPDREQTNEKHWSADGGGVDAMEVDSEKEVRTDDDWTSFELTRGWQGIIGD